MLNAAVVPQSVARIPYGDPVAQELLGDEPGASSLGVFVQPRAQGLGFWAVAAKWAVKALPYVTSAIRSLHGGGAVDDPISAVWKALGASAVNARVGPDGYWYDLTTGAKLSSEEADDRREDVVAATIHAHVGADGWWVDNTTGQTLTHGDVWKRYQQLSATGAVLGPGGASGTGGATGPGGAPVGMAGLSMQTLAIAGAVGLGLLLLTKKRGR